MSEGNLLNTFVWIDLATTDADSAKQFYGDLFGWNFRQFREFHEVRSSSL